jgi:histidinol-phosphate aminotransferase
VVLDEAYWSYDNDNTSYVRELLHDFPQLLIVRTFSKYYALAGIRIGFAMLGGSLTRLSQYSARYLGYHRLSEEVALAALDSEAYYRDIARRMGEDRQRYYDELGSLPGFTVYRSDANFVLIAIPRDMRSELKEYLTERRLIVKFMNEDLLNSHLRITLGTEEQNRILIDAIRAFVHERVSV